MVQEFSSQFSIRNNAMYLGLRNTLFKELQKKNKLFQHFWKMFQFIQEIWKIL